MKHELVEIDGVKYARCPKCRFLNSTGVCPSCLPTPPATPACEHGQIACPHAYENKVLREQVERLYAAYEDQVKNGTRITLERPPESAEITSLRARLAEAENSLRVSQMLYCGVSERCKEAEARAGRAEEAVKKLESDPRMGLRFTIGVSGRTMYATDDERTSDATASALSEAVGMVTWVKDHAARAAVEGAR